MRNIIDNCAYCIHQGEISIKVILCFEEIIGEMQTELEIREMKVENCMERALPCECELVIGLGISRI